MKINWRFPLVLFILGFGNSAWGQGAGGDRQLLTYEVSSESALQFTARITGSSFVGESSAVSGSVKLDAKTYEVSAAQIVVDAKSFKTKMKLRDQHMNNKYLEVKKYPTITFTLKSGEAAQVGSSSKLVGTLVFHGVSKDIELDAKVVGMSADEVRVRSEFTLNITDYGIKQPKFMVVKMKPELELVLTLVLRKQ